MSDLAARYRSQFPILGSTNYLISNSLGAVPEAAGQALQSYYETWASRGVRAWEETWWTMAADLGDLVAPLIGAGPAEVVFQPSVTLAHAVAFGAFDYARRPKIVTDAMHFPSVLYLIAEQARDGAEVVVVPSDDGVTVDSARVAEAIDERTAFVNVSHVLFKSSYVHDIELIARRAREVGAISIVDGYQSVGSIPVDVAALGVDLYIGGCLKWLCGGPGAAFLWARPEIRGSLTPRLAGWMAHERPFAFEPTLSRRPDAWRFLHGTPSIASLYAAGPGLRVIGEVGAAAIRSQSLRQTSMLLDLADARGWRCTTPREDARRAGTVAIDVPNGYAVSRALKAREILCDYRPGAGVRFSPHFYNLDDEVNAAVGALDEILERRLWESFAGVASTVT